MTLQLLRRIGGIFCPKIPQVLLDRSNSVTNESGNELFMTQGQSII